MAQRKKERPTKARNWTAVYAHLRSGAGTHRSSKEYDRSRCSDCDEKLDKNGLCPTCDEEDESDD